MKTGVILIILDGWGIGRNDESNPIYIADPPTINALTKEFPITSLQASGIAVGLPWGEVGNSEVGHLTLGAGKTLYQYFPKITLAIKDRSFFENTALRKACVHARTHTSSLHLIGLLTDANVHASLEHIKALIALAKKEGVPDIKLHLWADGKDCPPKTLEKLLNELPREQIATLVGRYYALDRNQNWQLTKAAYDLIATDGPSVNDPIPAIHAAYAKGLTEEYLPPIRVRANSALRDNDALVFWNFREDSIRQIAEAFLNPDFKPFPREHHNNIYAVTMTPYAKSIPADAAFLPDIVRMPLGRVLSECGKNQLRVAETYKYAHITYFFNGYEEQPFKGEYRVLVPSRSTAKPEGYPEMRATAITDRIIEAITNRSFDFILANYANPDTIAHTAHYDAALSAVRVIDAELTRIVRALTDEYTLLITSDHGNIEQVLNPATGLTESQHDPNPVPFHVISSEFRGRQFAGAEARATETMGSLADVAPTILELMGIPQPADMTGKSLLEGLI